MPSGDPRRGGGRRCRPDRSQECRRLQQVGSFLDLLDRPLNRFVAEFVGEPPMVFLPVHRVTADSLVVKGVQIQLPEPLAAALRATDDCHLTLGVRPNDISIVTPAPERLNGEVVLVQPQGGHAIVGVETSAGPATVVVPSDGRPAAGAIVGLVFESEAPPVRLGRQIAPSCRGRRRWLKFSSAGSASASGRLRRCAE
jgi:ABC-type sugar transport system ATPase subunit